LVVSYRHKKKIKLAISNKSNVFIIYPL